MGGGEVAVDGKVHHQDGAQSVTRKDHEHNDYLVFHRDYRVDATENLAGHHSGKHHKPGDHHRVDNRHKSCPECFLVRQRLLRYLKGTKRHYLSGFNHLQA